MNLLLCLKSLCFPSLEASYRVLRIAPKSLVVLWIIGFLHTRWSISENTWIQAQGPGGNLIKLFNLIYADDIILLATSYSQARRLLEGVVDILASIGLTLALDTCKFIVSPDLPQQTLRVRHIDILPVRSFTFLGVLMGFDINSQTILAARLSLTNNAFWDIIKFCVDLGLPFANVSTF